MQTGVMMGCGLAMARLAILIVAAGKGERAGGAVPKQFAPLLGRAMLRRSVEAFAPWADALVQVVIGPGQDELYRQAMDGLALRPPTRGGLTRQESVRLGLEALAGGKPDFVLIHDAARPLVSTKLVQGVLAALDAGAEAAIPLIAVADTLRKFDNGEWITVPRAGVLRAQTPQGFRFNQILRAHHDCGGEDVTDDMALAEMAGLKIVATPGEETNMKITTAEDFATAEMILSARLGETRTGSGFDAHRFTEGDHVWLCGLKLSHDHGVEGHSDADAALHALTDALLGAIGAGDIGQHFPPTDERWRGATSSIFLQHAAKLVRAQGGAIIHCDVTIICERPKVGPHREAMRARISEILSVEISRVSVKATTTEGMGFTGRREGIAAHAIATVRLP